MGDVEAPNQLTDGTLPGYEAFIVSAQDYDTAPAPKSWSKVMAMRHAVSKYPEAKYIWFLDQNAYIMNPAKSVEQQVMNPKTLESLMVKDHPVVPPDSIIKTFSHLRGTETDIVIAHDNDGIMSDSIVVRNGDWAKFFLEMWMDPLYRSYNFEKVEQHALVRCSPLSPVGRGSTVC